jgi:hypothetical protein
LIIENYKYRAPFNYSNNRHIKSIVKGGQGKSVRSGGNSHIFKTAKGTYDENLRPIADAFVNYEPTYNKFRINHYVTQSRSFFDDWKKFNGGADGSSPFKDESWWEEHDKNDVLDDSMLRFIQPLKVMLETL